MARVNPSSSSSLHLIHNLLRLPTPPTSVCLFLRPFCFSASNSQFNHRNKLRFYSFSSKSVHSFVPKSLSSVDEPDLREDDEESEEEELDSGIVSVRGTEDSEASEEISEKMKKKGRGSALKLSIKEKKELASYAHSLGDKLKCQLVGKSGVTDSVVFSFLETLEKNELLKVKIRKTSPDELEGAVQHLEEATGSVAVGQIGRTVILYRPSSTKMKAEEKKKKDIERMSITRTHKFTNTRPFRREYSERPDGRGRGRRGESRVSTA